MSVYSKKFAIFILCCLGFIIYSNTLDSSFHFDDELSIVSNLSIRAPLNLRAIWNFWPTRFITYLTVSLNYHLQQFNVFGYHLFNLTIHLISAILVWRLVLLTLSTPVIKNQEISRHANMIAFFTGLVFLSHPIQTQAVTYIIQRATSLASLFYLACLCFYVKSGLLQNEKHAPRRQRFYYFCSIISAVMAMFTKEMTLTIPLALILYEYCFLKTGRNINWKRLVPFLITSPIIPLVMFATKSVNFAEMRLTSELVPGISPWHYLLTQFRVMFTYLRLTFLPLNLNLDYDYPVAKSLLELPTLISLLFLGFILFAAFRIFAKNRLISFAIFWFFLTLLPESSIIPIKDVIFEHRLYLPMAGFSMFLVVSAYYLIGNKNLRLMAVLLLTIVSVYSILTYNRNFVWKNEFTLWDDVIRKSPSKGRAYIERGNAYKNKGDLKKAISDYNKAIEIDPGYANAYNNRGIVYRQKGNLGQALFDCNKAIQLNPKSAFFYFNRGAVYQDMGELEQAISDYSSAIKVKPDFALAYHNRGAVYQDMGDLEQAISDYSSAVQIEPNLALTYYNRGNVYLTKEKPEQAILDYSEAIRINSFLVSAYLNRSRAYFLKKEYSKSWEDVRKVKALGYDTDQNFLEELKKASGIGE